MYAYCNFIKVANVLLKVELKEFLQENKTFGFIFKLFRQYQPKKYRNVKISTSVNK